MEQLYQQETVIAPSLGDAQGLLAYDRAFALFMDAAAAHSEILGSGVRAMLDQGLFWLTVRSRARFLRRPALGEPVTLRTWPEQPGKVRVNRSYELRQGDEMLVAAKTEWTVLDLRTQRVSLVGSLFPPQLTYDLPSACPERFADVTRDYSGAEACGGYRAPCFEGDELELRRMRTEAGLDLAFLREGKPAFLARLG